MKISNFINKNLKKTRYGIAGNSIKKMIYSVIIIQILICVTIIVLLITMQIFENYSLCSQRGHQTASQIANLLNNEINEAIEITKVPIYESNYRKSFILKELTSGDAFIEKNYCEAYYSLVKAYLNENKFLDFIGVYKNDGTGICAYSDKDTYYFTNIDVKSPWYIGTSNEKGRELVLMPGVYTDSKYTHSENLICVARSIRSIFKDKLTDVGVIVIGININLIKEAFDEYKQFDNQQYAVFYNNEPAFGDNLNDISRSYVNEILKSEDFNFLSRDGGTLQISNYYYRNSISALIRTPLSNVYAGVKLVSLPITIVGIILLSILTYIIYNFSKSILSPLNRLVNACDETNGTFFSFVHQTNLPLELEHLFDAFNSMNSRIDNLINEGLRKDLSKKVIELQLLRIQINPHYLYNTLEFIHMQAFSNNDYHVARAVELLGNNLQYGFKNTSDEVLLKEEINQANIYMELISSHYKNQIFFNCQIDPWLMQCKTIKLIFQPILENAIAHGMIPGKLLLIEILGYRDGDNIIFEVFNDGKYIEEDRLYEIEENLHNTTNTSNSIGLHNIQRRLALYYGEKYGLSIRSVEGKGTVVTIRMPYIH